MKNTQSIDYDQCFFLGNLLLKGDASFLKGIFSNVFSISKQTKSLKCPPFLRLDHYILDESIWFGWINVILFTFNMFHPCFIHKDVNSSITPLESQFVLPKKIEIKIIDYDAYCEYNVFWRVSIFRSKEHQIRKSCTWGYKHAFVILGLKLGQFQNLGR